MPLKPAENSKNAHFIAIWGISLIDYSTILTALCLNKKRYTTVFSSFDGRHTHCLTAVNSTADGRRTRVRRPSDNNIIPQTKKQKGPNVSAIRQKHSNKTSLFDNRLVNKPSENQKNIDEILQYWHDAERPNCYYC